MGLPQTSQSWASWKNGRKQTMRTEKTHTICDMPRCTHVLWSDETKTERNIHHLHHTYHRVENSTVWWWWKHKSGMFFSSLATGKLARAERKLDSTKYSEILGKNFFESDSRSGAEVHLQPGQ